MAALACAVLAFVTLASSLSQPPADTSAPAVALIEKACDSGNFTSCRNLGVMYENGRGVERDDARAAVLFERSCTGKHAPGCVSLGFLYESGRGVAKDEARALALYQSACDDTVFAGCTNLGLMYANGRGVAKDEVRAVVFFTQACTGHFASGCASLGTAYENGRGVEKNLTRAVSFYDQACEHGFAPACHRLGGMYESGRGVAKDEARAATLYQRACEAGYTSGCTGLSAIYASGRVTPPAKSSPAAPVPPRSNPPAAIPPTTGRATTPPAGSVPERSAASGTAFAVSPHVLLTAHHIIDGRAFVAIRCAGGKTYPVTVTARAPLVDLAVLQVASNVTLSTYLPVGDEPAVLGQHVFTIGYPAPSVLGLEPKFTEGSISSQAGPGGDASFLQVSVPVQPGNSGGALLNDKGQVVGVMVSIAAPAAFLKDTGSLPQNISWAVKIALASPLLARTPAVDAPRATSFSREQLIANATAASCLVVALPRAPTAPK